MDLESFHDALINEFFIDIELTLIDSNNQITGKFHKVILYQCIYFQKLLIDSAEEKFSEIKIIVPNVHIIYDIIMMLYGQKTNIGGLSQWKYTLELIKCQIFLGLKIDTNVLSSLEFPLEAFDLYIDVAGLINYENCLERIIEKIPESYDLSKLPQKLIKQLMDFNKNINISISKDNSIKITSKINKIINEFQ